ncbi:hypothetical protein TNCV_224441 [Trichonephila clavipes]|nr:hypothetical protein TNCV_224441 [Trichonephila clavipes]
MADKDILEVVQNSKNVVDADSDVENEMNNALLCSHVIRNEGHHEKSSHGHHNVKETERVTWRKNLLQPSAHTREPTLGSHEERRPRGPWKYLLPLLPHQEKDANDAVVIYRRSIRELQEDSVTFKKIDVAKTKHNNQWNVIGMLYGTFHVLILSTYSSV